MVSSLHLPAGPTDRSRMQSHRCDTEESVHPETSLLVSCFEEWIKAVLRFHCLLLISSTDQKLPWDRIEMRCDYRRAPISDRTCCPPQTSVASRRRASDRISRCRLFHSCCARTRVDARRVKSKDPRRSSGPERRAYLLPFRNDRTM